ncbi:MAG: pilus assembly protein PilP [Burkholderiaceae bacterium]|nr:pilus assembly protein PilP [Burkholderiaceae bacterium]
MRTNTKTLLAALGAVAATTLLAGCGDDQAELREWMESVRAGVQPIHQTIAEPRRFEPYRYDNEGQVDPFSIAKLGGAVGATGPDAPRGGLKPDTNRPREALESYPLDAIRMVGHLANRKGNYALLQAESLVYQARVGNYAGQNFGMITRISDTEVRLKELVQDAVGDWVERETTLQIQDGSGQ